MFIYFFVICIIPLLVFSTITSNTLKKYFEDTDKKELLYEANKIAGTIQSVDYFRSETDRELLNRELEEKSLEESYRIIVTDSRGIVITDTNNTQIGNSFLVKEVVSALDGKDDANLRKEENSIYASAYIENETGAKTGVVLLISSFLEVNGILEELGNSLFLLTIGICILIGLFVFFTSQIIIAPLKNILKVIQKITDGQLNQRIEIKGHDEFAELGEAFNTMTEQLEQVDNSRKDFVSNVSHELKTPLSSIKVLSDSILLQEDMPTEMYREFLQDINSEIDRMTDIVNDLLALVKLDYREAGLNIDNVELTKMLREIIKRLQPLADKKDIELIYEEIKEPLIEADEMKLSLAVTNVIENAIKYTPQEGVVKVTIDGDHQNAFITVTDTGIGISEEDQLKIFNRFYRVDKTRDRETGGTGLGLAITHATILSHNGSIKVQSKEFEGSTFTIRLPIKSASN